MIGQALGLVLTVVACLVGLNWGMAGVAWALVASSIFHATYNYALAYRTIRTRLVDLLRAVAPALLLNAPLFAILAGVHHLAGDLRSSIPVLYLGIMMMSGSLAYGCTFLFLPIPTLGAEATRWREALRRGAGLIFRTLL
jgi:hypothetical protein